MRTPPLNKILDQGITMEDDFRTILREQGIAAVPDWYLTEMKQELYKAHKRGLSPHQVYKWIDKILIPGARRKHRKGWK